MELLTTVPLLIIDDVGMRKLAPTAAEELLEIIRRRYGDSAALTAMLDRLSTTVISSNACRGAGGPKQALDQVGTG
jgi:DNA replication protein DnaC